jgi:lipopolysaccharide biosynthesis protein
MKRIIIFAHFDKQNIIDPYVIDYLKELKKYSEIIFVSDGDLAKSEIYKIKKSFTNYL